MKQSPIIHTPVLTPRLLLIHATTDILSAILEGHQSLGEVLGVDIPEHWSEFGLAPFEYVLKEIHQKPEEAVWWSWLAIHRDENMLAGNGGFKGPPTDGTVEIGYEIAEACRGKGLAHEFANGLVGHAFSHPHVRQIIAHTLPEENASVRVLRKCGFEWIGTIDDSQDGPVWRWRLYNTRLTL